MACCMRLLGKGCWEMDPSTYVSGGDSVKGTDETVTSDHGIVARRTKRLAYPPQNRPAENASSPTPARPSTISPASAHPLLGASVTPSI